ncbi:MAG: GNAT family N-acetyltransferase [Planctomycetaceae bacterium]|jgi:ribosomal protein S18 acetylase RimI-like enzyme|nr:GNAT family N-acetyltransferase [Planctomycetaceae bacterium]
MLTIRSYRNEDPPRLLSLWKKSQQQGTRTRLMPLSMNTLQMQILGLPFLDRRSIFLAFENQEPVGYIHTTLAPTPDGFNLNHRSAHICFLCVDPVYQDRWGVARELLRAGEQYLAEQGVEEIFGGSPRPSAPFYIGFYGGSEPIAFFDSDQYLVQVFLEAGYQIFKNTARFYLNLPNYIPPMTSAMVQWHSRLDVEFNETPVPKTWWDACAYANFEWIEATAFLNTTHRPVARIRVRVANPDMDESQVLYGGTWDAGLMDIRVHPDFYRQGVAAYTLAEMLRYLVGKNQIKQIEAHIDEDSVSMYPLLRSLLWNQIDTGKIFRKEI